MRALASPTVPAVLVRAPRNGALIAIAARDRLLALALPLVVLLGLLLSRALLAHIVLNKVFKRCSNLLDIIIEVFVERQIGDLLPVVLNGPNAMANARCQLLSAELIVRHCVVYPLRVMCLLHKAIVKMIFYNVWRSQVIFIHLFPSRRRW